MSNEEFLKRLETALAGRVPQEEVDDAMRYHREYFAEAGENAADGIPAPEEVAAQIIRDWEDYLRKRRLRWIRPAYIIAVCVGLVLMGFAVCAERYGRYSRSSIREPMATPVTVVEAMDQVVFIGAEEEPAAYITLDPFEAIVIEGVSGNVTITSGDGFTLFTELDEGESLSCSQDGGTLHITGKLAGANTEGDISITVPGWTQLSSVSVKTDIGNIYLSDIPQIGEAELETSMGDISVSNSDETGYGALRCRSDLGNISVSSVRAASTLDCRCNAGSIDVMEFCAKETVLQTDMGSITAVAVGAREEYEMDLSVDLGRVSVDGQQRLNHYTTGGSTYLLTAKADAGDITVDFAGESAYLQPGGLHGEAHHSELH